jgi:lipopolysaccharide export system protein LptA
MMKIIYRTVLKIFSLFIIAGLTLPFTAAGAVSDSSKPINIEADRMVSNEADSSVVFIGSVDAKQGDLVIRSDEMTVYYVQEKSGAGKKNSSQVEKLICKGNVEISQGNWLGTGNRMDYYAQDRKVILSGDAKGWQGQNMVSGKSITYYLDEGRSVVEGPATADGKSGAAKDAGKTGRVKAVIHPEADAKK